MGETFSISIPARVNMLGNPTDACEVDYHTISSAVDLFGYGKVTPSSELTLAMAQPPDGDEIISQVTINSDEDLRGGEDDQFRLQKAAIAGLRRYSEEFADKFMISAGFSLTIWTEVPRQSGLGGSSMILLLTLAALRRFYRLDYIRHNDYWLAEVCQRIEEHELGIFCGFADRYVPLFGGLAYVDYRGKFHHKPLKEEPYATYERLESYVCGFPLIVVHPGKPHDSGDVHSRMRSIYLDECEKERNNPTYKSAIIEHFRQIGDTAWKGKIALLEGDWETLGKLMTENHSLINQIMLECGFEGGAGEINNTIIQAAMDAGAYGAKLTGAGAGGSVFAVVPPEKEDDFCEEMECVLEQLGCENGLVHWCDICENGVNFAE